MHPKGRKAQSLSLIHIWMDTAFGSLAESRIQPIFEMQKAIGAQLQQLGEVNQKTEKISSAVEVLRAIKINTQYNR